MTTEHPEPTTDSTRHPADRRDPENPGQLPAVSWVLHDIADKVQRTLDAIPSLVPEPDRLTLVDAHTLRQVARVLESSVAGQRGVERRQVER